MFCGFNTDRTTDPLLVMSSRSIVIGSPDDTVDSMVLASSATPISVKRPALEQCLSAGTVIRFIEQHRHILRAEPRAFPADHRVYSVSIGCCNNKIIWHSNQVPQSSKVLRACLSRQDRQFLKFQLRR
jgi:hypothetical protein